MPRIPLLPLLLFALFLLYLPVTFSYYCGYDDYTETHRAEFTDAAQPSLIFTTPHFGTNKYRPLGRLFTLVCHLLTPESPLAARLRNLFFHLLATAMVYRIALLLGAPSPAAIGAASLFGFNPLVNQNIVASAFVTGCGYAVALATLERYLTSFRRSNPWPTLAAATLLFVMALLMYESSVALLGVFLLFLFVKWRQRVVPSAGWTRYLAGATISLFLSISVLVIARLAFVSVGSQSVPFSVQAKNLALYLATLVFPIDLVGAHVLFGSPLPNVLLADSAALLRVAIPGALLLLAALVFLVSRSGFRQRFAALPFDWLLWALVAIIGALAPFLLFTDHASETYLYFPCAFFGIALAWVLYVLTPSQRAFSIWIFLLLAANISFTRARSSRVEACGDTSLRIARSIPASALTSSQPILLSPAPGQVPPPRFGMYNYRGIATVDPSESGIPAARTFLELLAHRKGLAVEVSPVPVSCPSQTHCFAISLDGSVAINR